VRSVRRENLLVVVSHPLGEDGAAAADDAVMRLEISGRYWIRTPAWMVHVVHALLGLLFDDFEHDGGVQISTRFHSRNRLHRWALCQWYGRVPHEFASRMVWISRQSTDPSPCSAP